MSRSLTSNTTNSIRFELSPVIPGVNNPNAQIHHAPGEKYAGESVGPNARIDDFDGDGNTKNDQGDRDIAELTAMKEFMKENPSSSPEEGLKALVKNFGGSAALKYQTHLIDAQQQRDPKSMTDQQEEDRVNQAGIEIGAIENSILDNGETIYSIADGKEHTSANTPGNSPAPITVTQPA
jgi:hypothetical protein